ncbi:hypothetical protein C1645_826466 [Glomus cerebriforme]|uniref:Uncharacterized protein n=1 Tax=Glomus cerebriforme TaxID=658196 RepID=A0A397SX15_9GLOM|nr:hypothetical protein C1645_826466 [Glomus cerebriforme]
MINIDEIFKAIHKIDDTLQKEEIFTNLLNKHHELQNFIKSYYQIRIYSFQIQKCEKDDYKFCLPIKLPRNVFDTLKFISDPMLSNDFDELYGTETKESLPSTSNSTKEDIPPDIINNNQI